MVYATRLSKLIPVNSLLRLLFFCLCSVFVFVPFLQNKIYNQPRLSHHSTHASSHHALSDSCLPHYSHGKELRKKGALVAHMVAFRDGELRISK